MTRTDDPVALNDWYAIDTLRDIGAAPRHTTLLGQDLTLRREDGTPVVREAESGRVLPVLQRYDCLWTTLGTPTRPLFRIPEADEPDRRVVVCGWVRMRTSGPRVVENFLDMAHFPYVHTNILGAEPTTQVPPYQAEIRRDVDEVWATNCRFFQPQVTASTPGDFVQLTYRVPSPYVVTLYRVCPHDAARLDVIALFIQPIAPDLIRAQPVMWLVDPVSSHNDLLKFEQVIYLQDRLIVENQRPLLVPLDPRAEIPMRADASSQTYRAWLREKGLRYGCIPA